MTAVNTEYRSSGERREEGERGNKREVEGTEADKEQGVTQYL